MQTTHGLLDLLESEDFRVFLRKALSLHYSRRGKINLSEFSSRAGFSSRSYLSELLSEKKGLSRDSLARIQSALKLPKPYLQHMELLAYQEYPALRPTHLTKSELTDRLARSKNHLKYLSTSFRGPRNIPPVISKQKMHQVYAALGSLDRGTTLAEIQSRTSLAEDSIRACLEVLVREDVATLRSDGRYFAKSPSMNIFGLRSHQGLMELFDEICGDIRLHRRMIIDDPTSLIFFSAFSVRRSNLPALREKMKEAIYDVLERFQDDDGDCVRDLFFTMK